MFRCLRWLLCFVIVSVSIDAPSAFADSLYLGEGLFTPLSIWRMDSEDPLGSFEALRDNTEGAPVRSIFLDAPSSTMYWSVDHIANSNISAEVRRGNLDAAGANTVPITTPLGQIYALEVDSSAGLIFFSTYHDLIPGAPTGIMTVPTAGGAVTPIFTHNFGNVSGLVVNPIEQKLYAALNTFDAAAQPDRRIVRMDYDGSDVELLYDLAATDQVGEMEIDFGRNRLAFILNNAVAIGSPDGTAPLELLDPVHNVNAIALSNDGQSVFFSDTANDQIYVIGLDGSGETLLRNVFNIFALESLVPEPSGAVLLSIATSAVLMRRSRWARLVVGGER